MLKAQDAGHKKLGKKPPRGQIKRIGSKDKRNYLEEPMRIIRNTLNCKAMGSWELKRKYIYICVHKQGGWEMECLRNANGCHSSNHPKPPKTTQNHPEPPRTNKSDRLMFRLTAFNPPNPAGNFCSNQLLLIFGVVNPKR